MANLSRLRELVSGRAAGATARPVRELTYEPEGPQYARALPVLEVARILGGRPIETRWGTALVIERRHDPGERHGRFIVRDCRSTDYEALAWLDPSTRVADESNTRLAFFDIETTGLSGGAGTLAFLIGIGWFEDDGFQTSQLLLTSHAAERAMLAAAADLLDGASALVTYNGRSFDVPVLETRWAFHRIPVPIGELPHLDMLHPARRLWKKRAEDETDDRSCTLAAVERLVLEFTREDDVPGFEIPSRFFRYLRSGDPRPLLPVLEHNRLDLVSLAAVTMATCRLVREGPAGARDAYECVALGRVFEHAGNPARAEECYARAATLEARTPRAEALHRLAVLHRRARRYGEAARLWEEVATLDSVASPLGREALRALAVHHEHRARDLMAARTYALQALQVEGDARRRHHVEYRLARLERKLSVQAKGGRQAAPLIDS